MSHQQTVVNRVGARTQSTCREEYRPLQVVKSVAKNLQKHIARGTRPRATDGVACVMQISGSHREDAFDCFDDLANLEGLLEEAVKAAIGLGT